MIQIKKFSKIKQGSDEYMERLEEHVFGAQGEIKFEKIAEDAGISLPKVAKDAIKMVESRKDDEDWGNFEPEDRQAIIRRIKSKFLD